ncbi:hypothetical protein BSZ07_36325 [Streptomyces sp. M1013]|nr:hypothetical protein BSZ07_36325 [Streptomyces sp. M1013]
MSWRGRPLTSHDVIVNSIAATTTRTGLTVHTELAPGPYGHRHQGHRQRHRRSVHAPAPFPRRLEQHPPPLTLRHRERSHDPTAGR